MPVQVERCLHIEMEQVFALSEANQPQSRIGDSTRMQ